MKHTLLNLHDKRKSIIAIALAICVCTSALCVHVGNTDAQEPYQVGQFPIDTHPSVVLTLDGSGSVISGESGSISVGIYVNNLSSSTRITSILCNGETLKFEHNAAWASVELNSSTVGTQSAVIKANSIKVTLSTGAPLHAPSADILVPYVVLKKGDSLSNMRYITKLTSSAIPNSYRISCTKSGTTEITQLDSTLQAIDSTKYTITGILGGYELGVSVDSGRFATWYAVNGGTKSTTDNPVGTAAEFTALLSPADTILPATGGLIDFNASFTSTGTFSVAPHVVSWSLQKTAPVAQSMPAPLGHIDTERKVSFLTSGSYTLTVTMFATDVSGTTLQDTASATVTVPARAMYTFTLTYTAGANGTISGTSPQTVPYGGRGTAITANPSTGYHFVNWSDDSTANPRTDTKITTNMSVTANFAINTYTITASAGSNGTVTPAGVTTKNYGDSQAYTITPTTGYHIVSVTVDGSAVATTSPYTFTAIAANHSISATFAINYYTVTFVNGLGTTLSTQSIAYGGNATPPTSPTRTGYAFADWSGAYAGVTSARTITAIWNILYYTITWGYGPEWWWMTCKVPYGGTVTLPFTVGSISIVYLCSEVVDGVNVFGPYRNGTSPVHSNWDGAQWGLYVNYTFSNVTANHTLRFHDEQWGWWGYWYYQ